MSIQKKPKMVLGNKGLIVEYDSLKKYLGPKNSKALLNDLTLVKKKFAGRDRTITLISKIYKFVKIGGESPKTLLTLPRFFQEYLVDCPPFEFDLITRNEDFKALNSKKNPTILLPSKFLGLDKKQTIVLNDYQQVIHDHLMTVFKPDLTIDDNKIALTRGCVLVLDTGRGKTYTSGGIIRTLGVKTLVVAHNSRGLAEWEKMLKCFPNIKIGYYCTGKKLDGDVVIMVVNSAMRTNFTFTNRDGTISRDKYFKEFGLAIYDEVPEYLSEQRRALFWDTNFKYVLGLTATPDENLNDWDPIYKMHLGPLVKAVDIPGFTTENVEWDFTVRAINYYGPPEFTQAQKSDKTGNTVCAWMDDQLVKDPYRNKMLIDIIKEYYEAGHCIFIFGGKRSVLTEFGEKIQQSLGIDPLMPEDENQIKSIMGGCKDADVKAAMDQSRIILTTYQYGSKGLSIGKMTHGIQLTPRRHGMKQVTGRLTRADGDTSIARVWVDVRDCNTSLKSQKTERNSDYREKGFEIEDEDINWEDIDALE